VPRPKGMPPTGPVKIPEPTAEDLRQRVQAGNYAIGSPEEIIRVLRRYQEAGADQLIFSPLTVAMEQKHVLRSIETFGDKVIPQFDKDPLHRTRRLREQQC